VSLRVTSPVAGAVVELTEVPDPVFAEAMVGPGLAVRPDEADAEVDAVAPVSGTVATLHPHAFVVATEAGPAVLVHLGIDTVKMKGEGFTLHVAKGDRVAEGQPVIAWNPRAVRAAGYATICPVIALDASAEALTARHSPGAVQPGESLFEWVS
jgi:PTS system N-acetylglucosamine-specific IIA component